MFAFSGVVRVHITGNEREAHFDPRGKIPAPLTHAAVWGVTNADREQFRRETAPVLQGVTGDFARAQKLLDWTRMQCRRIGGELDPLPSPWAQLTGMRAGKAAACGPFAYVLRESLLANDIPARVVMLMRDPPLESDGHAAVEGFIDGKWTLLDPTFNAWFRVDGKPASAWDVRQAYFHTRAPIERVQGNIPLTEIDGVVRRGPNIDTYYINYFVQFNDVVYQYYDRPRAMQYGLIRYPYLKLLQTPLVHLVNIRQGNPERSSPFAVYNILLRLIYIWLPTLVLVCMALLLWTWTGSRRAR